MIIITYRPQTILMVAWLSYAYYMWGKLAQYCGYHLCRLVQGVQRGLHGRFCLVLSCSNSTWTSDDASAPVVAVGYNCLWKPSFALSFSAYAPYLPSYLAQSEGRVFGVCMSNLYGLGSIVGSVWLFHLYVLDDIAFDMFCNCRLAAIAFYPQQFAL